MKIDFFKRYENGNTKNWVGNKHILKLSNGEKIVVATDKESDVVYGKWWNVTDIETGIAVVGLHEHLMFIYPFENSNDTEKGALGLAKERLDMALELKNITYKQLVEDRLNFEKLSLSAKERKRD